MPVDRVRCARADVTAADGVPVEGLSDRGVEELVRELSGLAGQVEALRLRLAGVAEERRLAEAAGEASTEDWLAKLTGERREQLRGGLWLAQKLQDEFHVTRDALAAGRISTSQARVIVQGLVPSSGDATPTQQAQAEDLLVQKATGEGNRSGVGYGPAPLRRAARRVYARIDAELSARHLERTVRKACRSANSNTWLMLSDNGDGTYSGRFSIPELHGRLLRTVLDQMTAPRVWTRDRDGKTIIDNTAGGDCELAWADRLGAAFCELIEHLPTDRLAKSVFTLLVMLSYDDLTDSGDEATRTGSGVAETSSGADLEASEARRLACEAGIVPAVLGGPSAPLDLGRTRRLHSEKQRQALALRFHTCAIAGCERPFAWTEVHHPQPWSQGGRTDLRNALPLCWHHHRRAHRPGVTLVRHDDLEWTLTTSRTPPRRSRAGPQRE